MLFTTPQLTPSVQHCHSLDIARPREFDPQQALASATKVFWRLGYENTSLDVLIREMGIAKQSLYNTFGGKRSLYLQALAHYRDGNHAMLRDVFRPGQPVRDGFARLLFDLSAESREQHQQGCLLLSANLERAAGDEEIAEFLRHNQQTVESIFTEALLRAQASGELSAKQDTAALARFFVVTIQGMRAIARLNSDHEALEKVAKVALTVFDIRS
jgi:TetR/AcrR family transcriptional repressor of nem operon